MTSTLALADPVLEVAGGIDRDQFFAEVERCFSCGLCSGCSQCVTYCTLGVFSPVASPAPGRYFEMNLDLCVDCGKCIEVCPCGYLEVAVPAPS